MSWPENTTNLSVAGVLKWLFIIASLPCFFKAFQGIVLQKTASGYGQMGASSTELFTGTEAVKYGLENLGLAALSLGIAWALWFFWQQNED